MENVIINEVGHHNITKKQLAGRHPFFEDFPKMIKPFHKQMGFFSTRELMVQQNIAGGVEYALEFMEQEYREMEGAVRLYSEGEGDWEEIEKEASDIAIVAFILPAFGSVEDWEVVGDEVLELLNDAMEIVGFDEAAYAEKIEEVITGKNAANHPPHIYRALPCEASDEEINFLYRVTRAKFKPLRTLFSGEVFPTELNTVLRLNGKSPEKFQEDPAYAMTIATLGEIEKIRNRIVRRVAVDCAVDVDSK